MDALQYNEIPLSSDFRIDELLGKHYKMLFFLCHYTLRNQLQTDHIVQQVLYDTYLHIEEPEVSKEEQIRTNLIQRTLDKLTQIITNRRNLTETEIGQRDTLLTLLETSLGLNNVTARLYQTLPPYDRMLFSLYYLEYYDYHTISTMLHASPYRIRNRLDEITATIEKLVLQYKI
jgi:DNA-directed RNA polymerase specialized sigma24 family protein